MQQNHSNREVYSNTILPQETSTTSNKKKPNLTWEATRERRAKPKISRRKEITKIRAEINEIETKKERKKRSKKPKLVL